MNHQHIILHAPENVSLNGSVWGSPIRLTREDDEYEAGDSGVYVLGLAGDDAINGGKEKDLLIGGLGDDHLFGIRGNDVLRGGFGVDSLDGSFGNDRLSGSDGADFLSGGIGEDVLYGGTGADTITTGYSTLGGLNTDGALDRIVYKDVSDSTVAASDRITDFDSGVDKIDLRGIDADATAPGNDRLTWIADAAFTGHAGELRVDQLTGTEILLQGDVDGDGQADLQIRVDFSITHDNMLVVGDILL